MFHQLQAMPLRILHGEEEQIYWYSVREETAGQCSARAELIEFFKKLEIAEHTASEPLLPRITLLRGVIYPKGTK